METPYLSWSAIKSKEFLAKSPTRSVPLLELESTTLFDTHAIMIYIAQLAQSSLYLGNSEVLAEIDAWLEFIQTSLEPALMNWTYPFLGVTESDQKVVDKASGDVKKQLKELDKGLKKSNFLCGGELTIADISLACALVLPLRTVLDEKFLKGLKVLMKWFRVLGC